MSAILWPLVVLLLGSGALALVAWQLAPQRRAWQDLVDSTITGILEQQMRMAKDLDAANANTEAAKDLDDRLKRLELAQEFRT